MATTLYLRSANPDSGNGMDQEPNLWDGSPYADSGNTGDHGSLLTTRGSVSKAIARATIDGPTAGHPAQIYGSLPVSAAVTISGTVTFNIRGAESDMMANAGPTCALYKLSRLGVLTLIASVASGVEWGTGEAAQNFTATPTSTDLAIGDRLVLFVGDDDTGGTMVGLYSTTRWIDGPTSGASGDSWISLTETLSFDTSTPAGTSLYLTGTASAITDQGAGVDEKEMWTSRGGGVTTAVTNSAAGPSSGILFTTSAGGNTIEWYSRPLAAFTLSGKVFLKVRASANVLTNLGLRAELAVVNGDGSSPTVWSNQQTTRPNGTQDALTELTGAESTHQVMFSGPSTAVSEGQRIRLRFYLGECRDDDGAMVSGNTGTVYYAGAAGATGDTFLTFTQTLTESSANPPITPSAIASAEAVSTPIVLPVASIIPSAIASAEALGTPALIQSSGLECLFVVANSGAPTTGEQILQARIQALGHAVILISGTAAADLTRDFIVISEALNSADVLNKYENFEGGVLLLEPGLLDDMDMATASLQTTGTQLDIVDSSHPLAAGKSGTVTAFDVTSELRYANDIHIEAAGDFVAVLQGQSDGYLIFAYEEGEQMVASHFAEGRRAFFGLGVDTEIADWTVDTEDLFDAAVIWVASIGHQLVVSAISSQEAFGTPALIPGAVVIAPSSIASQETFGTPTLKSQSSILPAAINSAESIGTPLLIPGGTTVQPGAIASQEAFGTPSLLSGNVFVQPTAIDSGESVNTPALSTTTPSRTIEPSTIVSEEAFGTPALLPGAIVIAPTAILSTEAIGNHQLIPGAVIIRPPAIVSAEAVSTPSLIATATILPSAISSAETVSNPTLIATATIQPSAIDSAEAVPNPNLGIPIVTVNPSSIGSAETFGLPQLIAGTVIISPVAIGSEEAVPTPILLATAIIQPSAISSTEAVSSPTLIATATILPASIGSAEVFGSVTLVAGGVLIQVTSISSAETFGSPIIQTVGGPITIAPDSIVSAESVSVPTVLAGGVSIQPSSINSAETSGSPIVLHGTVTIGPASIDPQDAYGTPTITTGNVNIVVSGIPSAETFGNPTLIVSELPVISPTSIGSGEALGQPTLLPVAEVFISGIPSEEILGLPSLVATAVIVPESIAPAEALGFPILTTGGVFIIVEGIPSEEVFGLPANASAVATWHWLNQSPKHKTTKRRGYPVTQSGFVKSKRHEGGD